MSLLQLLRPTGPGWALLHQSPSATLYTPTANAGNVLTDYNNSVPSKDFDIPATFESYQTDGAISIAASGLKDPATEIDLLRNQNFEICREIANLQGKLSSNSEQIRKLEGSMNQSNDMFDNSLLSDHYLLADQIFESSPGPEYSFSSILYDSAIGNQAQSATTYEGDIHRLQHSDILPSELVARKNESSPSSNDCTVTMRRMKRRRVSETLSDIQEQEDSLHGSKFEIGIGNAARGVTSLQAIPDGGISSAPSDRMLVDDDLLPTGPPIGCRPSELPLPAEISGEQDGTGRRNLLKRHRRPLTWPTRQVRKSWNISIKALTALFEKLEQ